MKSNNIQHTLIPCLFEILGSAYIQSVYIATTICVDVFLIQFIWQGTYDKYCNFLVKLGIKSIR